MTAKNTLSIIEDLVAYRDRVSERADRDMLADVANELSSLNALKAELLDALHAAYAFISAPQRMDTPKDGPKTATYRIENYNALTAKLRAAIAKAEGR